MTQLIASVDIQVRSYGCGGELFWYDLAEIGEDFSDVVNSWEEAEQLAVERVVIYYAANPVAITNDEYIPF